MKSQNMRSCMADEHDDVKIESVVNLLNKKVFDELNTMFDELAKDIEIAEFEIYEGITEK